MVLVSQTARARGTQDGTTYGRSRSSTKSFFRQHLAAVSSAIVYQDAVLLANAAATLAFQAFPRRPGAGSAP